MSNSQLLAIQYLFAIGQTPATPLFVEIHYGRVAAQFDARVAEDPSVTFDEVVTHYIALEKDATYRRLMDSDLRINPEYQMQQLDLLHAELVEFLVKRDSAIAQGDAITKLVATSSKRTSASL